MFSMNQVSVQLKKKNKKSKLALTPLIEDHDEVVLFCERIREGLRNEIDSKRLKNYLDWFKSAYLDPHFEIEKRHVFPILGLNNVRVKRALANHRRINRLFEEETEIHKTLHKIEEELSSYISFEERILYSEIRTLASPEQMEKIEKGHFQMQFSDDWTDRFWE